MDAEAPRRAGEAVLGGEGRATALPCLDCGHAVEVLDPRILERGPVRCGACGAEVHGTRILRLVEELLGGAEG